MSKTVDFLKIQFYYFVVFSLKQTISSDGGFELTTFEFVFNIKILDNRLSVEGYIGLKTRSVCYDLHV
jgi:hypothetical protein